LCALVAALSVALWQARVAHEEAARANRQTHHVEAVRDFLVSVFKAAQPDVARERRPTVEQLVDDAGDKLLRDDALEGDTGVDLLLALAEVNGAIGGYEREHALLDRATADLGRLPAPPNDTGLRLRVLRAQAYVAQWRPEEAIALLEPLHASLLARGDGVAVEALLVLADALSSADRSDEMQAMALDARAIAEHVAKGHELLLLRVDALRAHDLVYAQKFEQGLTLADAVWTRSKAQLRDAPREALGLLQTISIAAEKTGDLERADAAYREAIATAERVYVRPHPDSAWVVGAYGSFLVARVRYDDAEPYVVRALAMRRALFGDTHPDTLNSLATLGRLRSGQMRRDEARAAFEEGIATCQHGHIRDGICSRLAALLSQFLAGQGDPDGALTNAEQSVAMQRELGDECETKLIGPLGILAGTQVKLGRYAAAVATTDELLAIAVRHGSTDSKEAQDARSRRAVALDRLGNHRVALDPARDVVAVHEKQALDEQTPLFPTRAPEAAAMALEHRFDKSPPAAAESMAIRREP
jgi:serine/threonine-protein kinase